MGGPSGPNGEDTSGILNYVYGMSKDTTEGSPSSPCLRLNYPSMFRFRWVVRAGPRRIAIRAKQINMYSTEQRPSLTVKASAEVGLLDDITAFAPNGTDWVTIGPISFTATGMGMVYVEIRNNLLLSDSPAFFDHIITS